MSTRTETPVSRQAALWISTLRTGGAREHKAFAAWLKESPQHVREFLLMTALERELTELDLRDMDVGSILASAGRNVVRLDQASSSGNDERRPRPRLRIWLSLAAGIALVAIAAWLSNAGLLGTQEYSTAIGEQRAFELADGSVVQLNPVSVMRVRLGERSREIRLLEGEAIFTVKHDGARPFRVHSGNTLIEDIGTQFHVRYRKTETVVSVIEGAVDISQEDPTAGVSAGRMPTRVDAGQQARVAEAGGAVRRSLIDAAQLSGWRKRHLTFSGDTLSDIAADFNRYNRTPHIRVEGDALRARRFSGGFDADDPESLVEYLRQSDDIVVERDGDNLILRPRPE